MRGSRSRDTVRRALVVLLLSLGLHACTITQEATPVMIPHGEPKVLCVIEDPKVDATFLPALRAALQQRGFTVQMLAPDAALSSCPLTATYYARWSWDFTPYMSHAKITVYRDGAGVGYALYDAPKAGTSLTFRIYESTESKINTMVAQLFPNAFSS